MRVAVLGTGMVGTALATKLAELGHVVTMGSRSADNEDAARWASQAGGEALHGTFEDAAAAGQIVVNATAGGASLDALSAAGERNLAGKVLIDVANPLDSSGGMPPTLSVMGDDSLGEQIQRAFPEAMVVKALNTMSCRVMVDPARVPGDHDVLICGDEESAKAGARELLASFGWPERSIIDLGDISAARGIEAYVLLWLRLFMALDTTDLNIKVAR